MLQLLLILSTVLVLSVNSPWLQSGNNVVTLLTLNFCMYSAFASIALLRSSRATLSYMSKSTEPVKYRYFP